MGKSKKGKKEAGAADVSDNEAEVEQTEVLSDVEDQETSKKGGKKSKKTKKSKVEDSEDEDEDSSSKKVPPKTKKELKREKKSAAHDSDDDGQLPAAPISAFALLQADDSDDDVGKTEIEEEAPKKISKKKKSKKKELDDDDDEAPAQKPEKSGKKEKRRKDKRGGDDDEDIDKMLAELQLEYEGVKKPEEPKKVVKTEEKAIVDDDKSTSKKKKKKTATVEPPVEEVKPPQVEESTDQPSTTTVEGEPAAAKKKKGPGKAMVAAMQEALKKKKEEEDRLLQIEEEKIRLLEEADRIRDEKEKLEREKKEKKKQKEKEKKERLKAEGKLLTAKQKADQARAKALLDSLKASGVQMPATGEKPVRLGTRIRPNKKQPPQKSTEQSIEDQQPNEAQTNEPQVKESVEVETTENVTKTEEEAPVVEEIKESWDVSSGGEEEDEEQSEKTPEPQVQVEKPQAQKQETDEESSEQESSEDEEESESEEESSSSEEEVHVTDAQKLRERAELRIQKRESEAEKNRTTENLRAAVVCVLGHVDTGKTKILDKLRRTNVQDGEAGGITQQIGATNVPIEAIHENTRHLQNASEFVFKIPGLLIIDTPGHESFSNLRSRGSSLCDIAILVVDIMHGLEPQTLESITLLKTRKTPFVVALNKIDRLYDWETMPKKDIRDILKSQQANTMQEFNKRVKEIVVQFAEQGLNAALFYENPDPRTYVSVVPTSAITGEGMGNLLHLVVQFSQNQLAKRLMYSETLQSTVLEVKAIPGLGTTIDVILINGRLKEGDTMILAGSDGPIVTQIKALLMPQPMKELRVKNAYVDHKEIQAAQGVKIAAKELEKAIAGLNMQVAQKADEVEIYKDIVARELKSALRSIKLSDQGVFVQASTLGSLEALLEFLKTSKIPYAGIRIGPVVKRDVMKASIMLEHQPEFATILAFDVKIERDAQEYADHVGVKIFQADIIYHLFDKFTAYREELKAQKRDQFKSIAVFPCKLKVLPQFVFNSRDPIVMGVMVEAGIVKEGTPICVPSKNFEDLGIVTSIECNHKQIPTARKGMEVCIKIEPIPGETPKMFGRHFDEKDLLMSKISRQSIDACKDYFRDDLVKSDWALMVELKKLFQIL